MTIYVNSFEKVGYLDRGDINILKKDLYTYPLDEEKGSIFCMQPSYAEPSDIMFSDPNFCSLSGQRSFVQGTYPLSINDIKCSVSRYLLDLEGLSGRVFTLSPTSQEAIALAIATDVKTLRANDPHPCSSYESTINSEYIMWGWRYYKIITYILSKTIFCDEREKVSAQLNRMYKILSDLSKGMSTDTKLTEVQFERLDYIHEMCSNSLYRKYSEMPLEVFAEDIFCTSGLSYFYTIDKYILGEELRYDEFYFPQLESKCYLPKEDKSTFKSGGVFNKSCGEYALSDKERVLSRTSQTDAKMLEGMSVGYCISKPEDEKDTADIHISTAAKLMGISVEEFKKLSKQTQFLRRNEAKAHNFASIYGNKKGFFSVLKEYQEGLNKAYTTPLSEDVSKRPDSTSKQAVKFCNEENLDTEVPNISIDTAFSELLKVINSLTSQTDDADKSPFGPQPGDKDIPGYVYSEDPEESTSNINQGTWDHKLTWDPLSYRYRTRYGTNNSPKICYNLDVSEGEKSIWNISDEDKKLPGVV